VFDRIRNGSITTETVFNVSEEAWRRGGAKSGSSTMFLDLNSTASVGDLLRGVIIQSGNDACIVLAEGIAGSETAFSDMMTKHAREIGLESATFRNSTGWPHPEHKISVYDLGLLAQRTIRDYSEFYPLYAERSFTWNGITQGNRNPLLGKFQGADGLKTGHTEDSGYGLVASAIRGEQRRIVVVNGLESKKQRQSESLRLMQAAFDSFRVYSLYPAETVAGSAKVYMGKAAEVDLVTNAPVDIGLGRGARSGLKVHIKMASEHAAPIAKGDHLADLVVTAPDMSQQTFPLFAANNVERKSAFGRAAGALVNLIRG